MPDRNGLGILDRLPLRVVLIAALLVIVSAGLLASGTAVTVLMRDRLMQRVDDTLTEAASGWAHRPPDEDTRGPRMPTPNRDRPPSEFYVQLISAEGVADYPVNDHDTAPDIGDPTALPAGRPVTVGSADGRRVRWRVLATDTSGARTVLAVPIDASVDDTVTVLILVQLGAGLAVVALVIIVGPMIIRRSMRPLKEVEKASRDIAAGDLSRRLPARPIGTEVGALTHSFNEMAARVEGAFAEVEASETTARRSEQRMRRFVADAGHELRTPLTSIRGFAELHSAGAVDADTALDRIGTEARRMTVLIEDLLTLARLDAERPIDQRPVDLVAVAREAVGSIRTIAPEREFELVVNASPEVTGDTGRIRQVIMNLLVNTVRHTPPETRVQVIVSISDGNRDGQGALALLTVADNGPGMSEEDAVRIFDRFTRLDDSRSRGTGGSGLGLSIVQGIVEAHGGSVSVRTAPGDGAAFTVALPVTR